MNDVGSPMHFGTVHSGKTRAYRAVRGIHNRRTCRANRSGGTPQIHLELSPFPSTTLSFLSRFSPGTVLEGILGAFGSSEEDGLTL